MLFQVPVWFLRGCAILNNAKAQESESSQAFVASDIIAAGTGPCEVAKGKDEEEEKTQNVQAEEEEEAEREEEERQATNSGSLSRRIGCFALLLLGRAREKPIRAPRMWRWIRGR